MSKKYKSVPVKSSEITPEDVYLNRREFLKAMGIVTASAALLAACAPNLPEDPETTNTEEYMGARTDELGDEINSYDEITMQARQLSLLGVEPPRFDARFSALRRVELHSGAWIEYQPSWVSGHEPLYDALNDTSDWQAASRTMYERVVDVPRLLAHYEPGTGPPIVASMAEALSRRYGVHLPRISMALYRDGRDSVAWHRDKVLRDREYALMAIVSLGEPRRFMLRPVGGGASQSFHLGWGDLLVMGGTTQRTWEHCVPKVKHAGPRMSLMFRPAGYDDD